MALYKALFKVKINDFWNIKDIIPKREAPMAFKRIK